MYKLVCGQRCYTEPQLDMGWQQGMGHDTRGYNKLQILDNQDLTRILVVVSQAIPL